MTRAIHVFDSDGTPLFDRELDPAHFDARRATGWLAVRADGSLFVDRVDAIEEIGPRGEHVGTTVLERYRRATWLFPPTLDRRWCIESCSVEMQLSDGAKLHRWERGANRRWLESVWSAATARDGALAVVDAPNPESSRDPRPSVHVFTPDGAPVRSLRIPDPAHVDLHGQIAFERGRIALLDKEELWMLSEEGTPLFHATLPAEVVKPQRLFFSPAGDELWVFPIARAEMFRFAAQP